MAVTNTEIGAFIAAQTEDATPDGANDLVLTYDASATAVKKVKLSNLPAPAGVGDVTGPGSATDGNFAAFDGTGGKTLKDSGSKAADFATASHSHTSDDLPASMKKRQVIFTAEGEVDVATGALRLPNHLGVSLTITGVYLHIDTAPTGADLIVDVNIDGTTCFTTQSNRPHIDAGAYSGNSTTIENATWADGHYITFDVDQVGSTVAGSNLTVTVVATE